MRSSAFVFAATLAACSSSPGMPHEQPDAAVVDDAASPDAGFAPPAHGFQIVTPTLDIDPGAEITFCYYFRTPNTTDLSIKRWASRMTPGSHHMVVFFTQNKQKEPGTMTAEQCGFRGGAAG